MTSREAALDLLGRIKLASELWRDDFSIAEHGGVVAMSGNKAKELLKVIQDQEAELEQLRGIFDDMVGHNDILHRAKMQERERCLNIIMEWAKKVPAPSPLMSAAKQIAKE